MLEGSVDGMVAQHLNLYDWGTSNPIYENLASSFVQPGGLGGETISGVDSTSPSTSLTVAGTYDEDADDECVLTEIYCGEGSYLERVKES